MVVYGSPEGGKRNESTESQLQLMDQIQKADVKLMKKGLSHDERYRKLMAFKDFIS
jgi:hypothetical protein